MSQITLRTRLLTSITALVVISPATTHRPVVTRVSHATRLFESCRSASSRIESEIWSAILSGCPSVTDSDGNMCRMPGAAKVFRSSSGIPFLIIYSAVNRQGEQEADGLEYGRTSLDQPKIFSLAKRRVKRQLRATALFSRGRSETASAGAGWWTAQ